MAEGKDIAKHLGSVIKEIRFAKNISQEKLAELGDLDRSYVSEIERGVKIASVVTVFKLAHALEIEPSKIIQKLEEQIKFQ